jgi:hypothetical protein
VTLIRVITDRVSVIMIAACTTDDSNSMPLTPALGGSDSFVTPKSEYSMHTHDTVLHYIHTVASVVLAV